MGEEQTDQPHEPPPEVGRWEAFRVFVWNSGTGQFLGRTGVSWAKILLFYVCFYMCLIMFFFLCLMVFYQTLDLDVPKWQLESSLIGTNPGLTIQPMHQAIRFSSRETESGSYKLWMEELDAFFSVYENQEKNIYCDYNTSPDSGKACSFDISGLDPCTAANYNSSSPCIILKLNKIFNWVPEYYDADNLPKKIPQDLKDHIASLNARPEKASELRSVWVSCVGKKAADVKRLGPVQYLPRRGFPGYYFPFQNQKGYLNPLVAVHFENPEIGVLINIECKVWAKNIHQDAFNRHGFVNFQLQID